MSLPNKITIFRIFLVPIIIGFLIWDSVLMSQGGVPSFKLWTLLGDVHITVPYLVAGILFIIAALSDALDGYLARKNNDITLFGKVFDPSADKILVNSTLIMMAITNRINVILVIIMISRDILVDTTRIVLGNKNIVVSANVWGKFKTIFQMIGIIILFFIFPTNSNINGIPEAGNHVEILIPLYLATIFSVLSGGIYVKKAWPHINDLKGEIKNEKK